MMNDGIDDMPPMSLVVEMEENYATNDNVRHVNPIKTMETNKLPVIEYEEDPKWSTLKSFVAPPQRKVQQPYPNRINISWSHEAANTRQLERISENVSKHRKLGTAERRQLRAHLRGSAANDGRYLNRIDKSTVALKHVKTTKNAPHESLEAAESGESLYSHQKQIGFDGEGLRIEVVGEGVRENSPTTSTDSDKKKSLNSGSSEGKKNVERRIEDRLGYGSDRKRSLDRKLARIDRAWEEFEKSWEIQVAITEEEIQNGFRFFTAVDTEYLGFEPKKSDKRKFLKAYPIIGPVPEARLGWTCLAPMTVGQWSFIVVFFVFFIGLATAAYFFFRSYSHNLS